MKYVLCALLLGATACKGKPAAGPGPQEEGKPVETQDANAGHQRPAFVGQTRAKYRTTETRFDTQVVVTGLEHPWALAFLPDGAMLVTERPGRLRIVGADGKLGEPIAGLPAIDARDQGGLLDVAVAPDFATSGMIFFTFAEAGDGGNGTALARGKLARDQLTAKLENVETIWRQTPKLDSTKHFGGRINFDKGGAIVLTLGERSNTDGRVQAQRLDGTLGKVVRINQDGTIPQDNPFIGRSDVKPEIYSIGHRNVQASAWNPTTGKLWVVDHGARGGDEINIVEAGKDYGWPTITYGIEYTGGAIGDGLTKQDGMEQPIYYWDPVIAPSGAAFYTADKFPAWKGSLFIGALAGKHLARLTIENDRVVGEERLLADRSRIRDVRVGPDGLIYLLTDEDQGELLRLAPQ